MTHVTTMTPRAEKIRLENGMTLLYCPVAEAPRVTFDIFIPGGNRLDPISGMADVIDRLLLKGTDTMSSEAISQAFDGLGADVDTETRRDYSLFYATALEEDAEATLSLVADCLSRSTFAEFEKEKELISGEVMMDLDSPKNRASDLFVRTVFRDTPYNAVGSVILEHLPDMASKEDLIFHYRQLYRPDRMVVAFAGNMPQNQVVDLLERVFPLENTLGAATSSAEASLIQHHSIHHPTLVTFPRDDSSQAHIFKGWLVPDSSHPDYFPMVLLNTILGAAGLSSRLFVNMRDKQGLAYNVRSSLEAFKYRGLFSLYIGTEPSNVQKCLDGFVHECQDLIDVPVSAQELDEAKRNLLGKRSVYLEPPGQKASYIGSNFILGRSLEEIEGISARIQAVTSEDIQRVAALYLTQPAVVSVVAPSAHLPKTI